MYNSFCNERLSLFLTRKLQDQQLHVRADDQYQLEFSDIDASSDEGSVFVCVHEYVWPMWTISLLPFHNLHFPHAPGSTIFCSTMNYSSTILYSGVYTVVDPGF